MAQGLAVLRFGEAGIEAEFDSAGIGDWHIGAPPDRRAVNAAWKVLVDLSALRARQIEAADFDRFDYIIAMDDDNYAALQGLAGKARSAKICRMVDFADLEDRQIADPYFGGHSGFDQVLTSLDIGIAGLIRHLRKPA
ncbi:Low molecular weight protein tyrosine phosphatase [hydrothermal vent metagenome]|uniref:protein-tyrosine-phosphatase n=1 Tax=hydrothermal vent metagenome TaxID=652676 RepID=A0A3B0SY57_9ZZZZ